MYNTRIDQLVEYPFQRLAGLLDSVDPAARDGGPLSMSIGEPQHPAPDLLHRHLAGNAALWNKYPPTAGTPDYRKAVADWLAARFNLPKGMIDPGAHVLPVAGTREGLFMAAQLCSPPSKSGIKRRILMPNPFYQVYFGAAVMAGGEPVFMPATKDTGFQPDLSAVSDTDLARASCAYLCSPANPQGTVLSKGDWIAAIKLARAADFVLIADECYSEIYSDTPPCGALEACAELGGDLSNVLVFNSLSKRSSVPGLRAGFVAGDPDLIAKFSKLRSHAAAVQALPTMAAATALWRDETHVEQNRALYRQKFDDAQEIFGEAFGFYRPAGGFFLWLDVRDSVEATKALWAKAAIKVLPGAYLARSDYAGDNPGTQYIRVALVHDRATTKQGLQALHDVLSAL